MPKLTSPQLKRISNIENIFNNDDVITQFVLNAMLHHVGMSCIISSKKEMDYDNFTNSKNLDWFDTVPWHNKNICSKLYGTTFEGLLHRLE